jgi:hypothetical protein
MPAHPPDCLCGDDDAHVLLEGTQDFLYSRVDRTHVVALNAEEGMSGSMVIRPWDEREQEDEVRVIFDSEFNAAEQLTLTTSIFRATRMSN